MESKKINQLATNVAPQTSDLTIIGDPITGVSKKISLLQIANLFATTGTVSSVAVTESGNALTITGSPITSAGTINIGFAGDASQYVRGDGALADFPTSTGGGSSVSYYLNSSVSQGTIGGVAYRQLGKTPISGAGTDITISANGYIASYITDANDPALLEVPAGNFNCEFYFAVNSNNHDPYVYAEVYKYDGTTFTLIGTSVGVPEYLSNGTTLSPYYFAIPVATAALTITDRIAIRIYANVDGRVVTLHTENGHLCQVVTTFSKGLTTLNNLTRQTQFFAVGTSGTDFNISSATATHTFNLPIASATNTGKLSSTDWSTFNSKQNTITLTTTGISGAATLIGSTLNIPNYAPDLSGYVTLGTAQTISGAKTFTSNIQLGNVSTATPTATPLTINLGDTFSNTAGANLKLRLFESNDFIYGIGISSGQMDFNIPAAAQYKFWSGNAIFTNNLTAATLIKSGGTSSQFLKADGSVDSSTYLTTSAASSTYLPLAGGTLTGPLSGTSATFSIGVFVGTSITSKATLHANNATSADPTSLSSIPTTNIFGFSTSPGAMLAAGIGTTGGSHIWFQGRNLGGAGVSYPIVFQPLGGNVGIGTSSPAALLDVNGVAYFRNAGGIFSDLLTAYSGVDVGIIYGASGNLIIKGGSGAAERMRITSGGNVGIGVTPSVPLEVYNTGASVTNNPGNSQIRASASNTKWLSIGYDPSVNAGYLQAAESGIAWRPLILNNNGGDSSAILIGTSTGVSGGGKVQVNGNVNINGVFQINGTTIGGGGGSGVTGSGTTNYIPKWTGSTSLGNSLIYDSGSVVAIGNTANGAGMAIEMASNASIPKIDLVDTSEYTGQFKSSGKLVTIQNSSNNPLVFGTNGSERMRIFANGSIGVNRITDAGYTFDVNGTGRFTGQLTGTDALFAGSVTASGGFFDTSDSRLKILVKDYEQPKGIENVAARMYVKNNRKELGYFAQEVEQILPSAVNVGEDGYLTLSYSQVHTAKIAYLENKVEQLEKLIKSLL